MAQPKTVRMATESHETCKMPSLEFTDKTSLAGLQINGTETDYSHPIFSSDYFMMFCYKVVPCLKTYRHDWRVCPYAHVGETAARRHPEYYDYVGVICPETKKGEKCPRGKSCPCTHSLFEYWLHPTRFKTEFCSRGSSCSRSFCFFAHSEAEVRVFDTSVLSSPMARKALSIAEGNEPSKRHVQQHQAHCCDVSSPSQINHPLSALDIGFAGRHQNHHNNNIWSVGQCDHQFSSRTDNLCDLSALSAAIRATASLPLNIASATTQAQNNYLWDGCALSLLNSGLATAPTTTPTPSFDIGNLSRANTEPWTDYRRQLWESELCCPDVLDPLATICKFL